MCYGLRRYVIWLICQDGFYPDSLTATCLPCDCSDEGSVSSSCETDGQCSCKEGVTGKKCDRCKVGYWGYSDTGCSGEYDTVWVSKCLFLLMCVLAAFQSPRMGHNN